MGGNFAMMVLAEQNRIERDQNEQSDLLPERRRGLRIRQSRPIKVYEPACARYFPGQTGDISSTGLRIELPLSIPIRPGKVVDIHVGLSRDGETLAHRRGMIRARVIWIDRSTSPSTGRLIAGIEFVASIAAQVDAA